MSVKVFSINSVVKRVTGKTWASTGFNQDVATNALGKFMKENNDNVVYYCRMGNKFSMDEAKSKAAMKKKGIVVYERIYGPL